MIQGDKIIKQFSFRGENMFNSTVTINFKGLEIVVKYYCEKKIVEFQFPITILEMEFISLFKSIEKKLQQSEIFWRILKFQEKKLIKEIDSCPIFYIITIPCQYADMKFKLSHFMNHNLFNDEDNYLSITPHGSDAEEFNHPKYKIIPLNLSILAQSFQYSQQQLDIFCRQITNTFLPIQTFQLVLNTLTITNEIQQYSLGFVPTQEFGIVNCYRGDRYNLISIAIKSLALDHMYEFQIRDAKAYQSIVLNRIRSNSQDNQQSQSNHAEEFLKRCKNYLQESKCQNIQEVESYLRRLLSLMYGFSVFQFHQEYWRKFEFVQKSKIEDYIKFCCKYCLPLFSKVNEEFTKRQMINYLNFGAYIYSGPAMENIIRRLQYFLDHNDGQLQIQFERYLHIKRGMDVHIVINTNQITLNDQPIDQNSFQTLDIYKL